MVVPHRRRYGDDTVTEATGEPPQPFELAGQVPLPAPNGLT
jgi:hypothetical protein